MRGERNEQVELFSYISIEDRIPQKHPLRKLRMVVDAVLESMSKQLDGAYSKIGRSSIAPEYLLKSLFLQTLYTIRSERQLCEHLSYNFLYRWFVGLSSDDAVWEHSTFSKNRDRLMVAGIADDFFAKVVMFADAQGLVSSEHFSVDGTLIEAWASLKTFLPKSEGKKDAKDDDDSKKDNNRWVDFKGEKRSNETHESKTDPEAKLYTKSGGQAAKMQFMGHVVMENRHGLAVDSRLTQATGTAERDAALDMAENLEKGSTLGSDKNYDTSEHGKNLKAIGIRSHVAQNIHAKKSTSSIDARTTRHISYEISQRKRMRIEEIFGWLKTIGLMRRPMVRGTEKLGWMFTFALSVYNIVRICNLME